MKLTYFSLTRRETPAYTARLGG